MTAVQPAKKRRGLIWWWLPGLLLVGSVAWFAWQALADDQARTQDAGWLRGRVWWFPPAEPALGWVETWLLMDWKWRPWQITRIYP